MYMNEKAIFEIPIYSMTNDEYKKRCFKYIDKIVYEWSKKGIKNHVKEENKTEELFDYDWLDGNEQ